jgi:hypothetical protein
MKTSQDLRLARQLQTHIAEDSHHEADEAEDCDKESDLR